MNEVTNLTPEQCEKFLRKRFWLKENVSIAKYTKQVYYKKIVNNELTKVILSIDNNSSDYKYKINDFINRMSSIENKEKEEIIKEILRS